MVYISPTERRTRHIYIEKTIRTYLDVLDQNDTQDGHIHPEVSKTYREIVNNFVIPNNRNGTLSLGKATLHTGDFIPVWAAVPDEEFVVSPELCVLTPRQIKFATEVLIRSGFISSDQEVNLDIFTEGHSFCLEESYGAMVVNDELWIEDKDNLTLIKSRPLMVLNMRSETGIERSVESPPSFHHEVAHLLQCLDSPALEPKTFGEFDDLLISDEIEAYIQFGLMVRELGRQNYTPCSNEQQSTFKPYSIAMEIADFVSKFDHPSPPLYRVDPGSEIIEHIRTSGLIPLITSNIKNDENYRNKPIGSVDTE